VEEFMREHRHGLMLKQELRKLREEDMQKIRERQKRLEFKKKLDILEKEKESENAIRQLKNREQLLVKKR
jgi:hypothetical protein